MRAKREDRRAVRYDAGWDHQDEKPQHDVAFLKAQHDRAKDDRHEQWRQDQAGPTESHRRLSEGVRSKIRLQAAQDMIARTSDSQLGQRWRGARA